MRFDPLFTDGVIVIDKPSGPTSHDIVAVMRRVVDQSSAGSRARARSEWGVGPHRNEKGPPRGGSVTRMRSMKVGHTGTLDPLASGVLPLVLGKATRLARFLSSDDKEYEADVELGVTTTTFDRAGDAVTHSRARTINDLTRAMIDEAVSAFRGTYLQQPPAFSAKKIGGDRAYDLARKNAPVHLQPVEVTATTLEVLEWRGSCLRLRLVCSAGYYVRSLAHALGERLGTGGHLARLVRTRSGEFSMAHAVGLDLLDRWPAEAAGRVIPLGKLLPSLPAVTLTFEGAALAARGGYIGAAHLSGVRQLESAGRVRLLHPDGHLVAIAEERAVGGSAVLHPSVVLE
jgi:tRNA pseudouridine55 synthase